MDDQPMFLDLDEHVSLLDEYEQARRQESQANEEVKRLREMILKLLPDGAEAPDGVIVTVDGKGRLSYRPQVRKHVDLAKLRDVYPSVATSCTGYLTTWTLRSLREPVE